MTFTPGIPASGQSLGNSRTQVLNNFAVLRSTIATNHIDVNNAGAGKHNLAEFVVQSTAPATAASEVACYSRAPAAVAEWYLQQASQISGASDVQLSNFKKGVPVAALPGFSWLPGGLLIHWGSNASVAVGTLTNFSGSFSFPTACLVFTPILTSASSLTPISVTQLTTTQYKINFTSSGNIPISYIAIGY